MLCPLSSHTLNEGRIQRSRHIVSWSTFGAAVSLSVQNAAGLRLVDTDFASTLCSIRAASVNCSNIVAVVCSLRGSPDAATLLFVSGCSVLHKSPPLPWIGSGAFVAVQCLRLGQFDLAFISGGDARHVTMYNRQRPSLVEHVVPLEDSVKLLIEGPVPGSVVAVLQHGRIVVIRAHIATDGSVSVGTTASVDTGSSNIADAVCSRGNMVWLQMADGRLAAWHMISHSSRAGSVVAEDADTHRLKQCTFLQGHDSKKALLMFDSGRSGPVCTKLSTDASTDAVGIFVAAVALDTAAVQVYHVAVGQDGDESCNLNADVLSLAPLPLDITDIVSFTTSSHTFTVLARRGDQSTRSRSGVLERFVFDAATQRVAAAAQSTSLCATVTWAEVSQLGLLRERCEAQLVVLETAAAPLTRQEAANLVSSLVALQHTSLAFLKRENASTACDLSPDNSVSLSFLRRLRDVYTRLACYQFMIRLAESSGKPPLDDLLRQPLAVSLQLNDCRHNIRSALHAVSEVFHEALGIDERLEHARDNLERWGPPNQPSTLVFDILSREVGVDVERDSLSAVVEAFPKRLTAANLGVVLLYVSHSFVSDGLTYSDLEQEASELCKLLSIREEALQWAGVAYYSDHVDAVVPNAGRLQVLAASSATTLRVTSGLNLCDSAFPYLPHLLPPMVDGLLARGALSVALDVARHAIHVYPRGLLPNGLGSKALFLAFRTGDASTVTLLAIHMRGTWGSCFAARVVALAASRQESLAFADGLYDNQSREFSVLVETLQQLALDEHNGSLMHSALLCELRLAAHDYDGTALLTSRIASGVAGSSAQKLHNVREHVRAHLANHKDPALWESEDKTESKSCSAKVAVALHNGVHQGSTCLRLSDAVLNDGVALTSASSVALRAQQNGTSKRGANPAHAGSSGSLGRALHAALPTHPLFGSAARHGSSSSRDLHHNEDQSGLSAVCPVLCGKSDRPCGNVRPCQFHDAHLIIS